VVYPNANHSFDSKAAPRAFPSTADDPCATRHGEIDLDAGTFTIESGGRTLKGADAAPALKQCTERGVAVGGDPKAREKAPGDVADFLKPMFALAHWRDFV
jgi:hypothetical protein